MGRLSRPDGCSLYFEVHGDPRRISLLLLEGLGGDTEGWRRNLPHLAAELFVVAYDFRGNGRSDAPDRPVTMGTFVDDTVALLDELGIARTHVYGLSFGGMVASELALEHPDRVRALVLGGTPAGVGPMTRSRARAPKGRPYEALYAPDFVARHPDRVREDARARAHRRQPPHAGRRQWEVMQRSDVSERLAAVAAPTLILHGTEDRIVDPRNARELATGIPGAELVLMEGAGHLFHVEQPERADELVLAFLRRHRDA